MLLRVKGARDGHIIKIPEINYFDIENFFVHNVAGLPQSPLQLSLVDDLFVDEVKNKSAMSAKEISLIASDVTMGTYRDKDLEPIFPIELVHIGHLLTLQPGGEPGELLTNGRQNTFFVRNNELKVFSLNICWSGIGWIIKTLPLHDRLHIMYRESKLFLL